jgi:hypothetical protein
VADEETPFHDVVRLPGGFSLPALKWRELVFIGALRPAGGFFVREPGRPLPPFGERDLFPEGVRFRVRASGSRVRVWIVAEPSGA